MVLGKRVAKNAKAIRIGKGLSQQDLAKRTGLTIRYISRLENTAPNVTLDVLERLINGLGCTVTELLGGSDMKLTSKESIEAMDQTIRFLQGLRSRL